MLTLITCPTCKHRFTTPEAKMGERHTCPNCQSLFLAGKSVAESDGKLKCRPLLKAALDKTMLGEFDPPEPMIKYNCPRCKKPLESPASEALTKKPCPACGGRLQVPAAPPKAPVGDPSLNKTLLAETSVTPSVPVNGGALPSQPTSSAPPTAPPPTPAATPTFLAGNTWKYVAGGVAAALLLLVALRLAGHSAAEAEYRKALAEQERKDRESDAQRIATLEKEIAQQNQQLQQAQESLGRLLVEFQKQMNRIEENARIRDEEFNRKIQIATAREDVDSIVQIRRERQKRDDEDRQIKQQLEDQFQRQTKALQDQIAELKRKIVEKPEVPPTIIQQPTVVPVPAPAPYWRFYPWPW
jgi:DNA-directed RNA polymerase subunit RPC12/RpoP